MQIARTRAPVQPFRITLFANVQRCVHVNFKKATNSGANLIAGSPIGRNGSDQSDDSIPGQQLRQRTNPSYILISIGLAETEVGPELLPDNVRIEHFHSITVNQQF
jgi:hypothetical protein